MNLTDFKIKYLGKTLCYPDGQYCGECLSLAKQYIKEVFGFNPPPSGSNSAYGYWSNFPNPLGSYFKKVVNTLEAVPSKGDIVIWNTNTGNGYGHIAIVLEATQGSFKSLDQNWGGKETHEQGHYYTNVAGWLTPTMQENNELQACMADRLKFWNERDAALARILSEIASHDATKAQLKKVSDDHNRFVEQLANMFVSLANEGAIIGAAEKLLTIEDQLSDANKMISKIENEKNALEADKNREVSKLRAEVDEVKKQNQDMKLQIVNQEADIKRLSERLDELTELPTTEKPESSLSNALKVVVNFIKGLWQKK